MQKITDIYYKLAIGEFELLQINVENSLRNYNYLLHHNPSGATLAIDPTDTPTTIKALEYFGWNLSEIWNTHHHNDHIGGNYELSTKYGCKIFANADDAHRIPSVTNHLHVDKSAIFANENADILNMDGHTIGQIGFYFQKLKLLFVGDTLFSIGCGRVFEGTYAQMLHSMQTIAALPHDTLICISHEYTLDNLYFALKVTPENEALQARAAQVESLRANSLPTVPTTIGQELATNPFLRTKNVEEFAKLRQLKDSFKRS